MVWSIRRVKLRMAAHSCVTRSNRSFLSPQISSIVSVSPNRIPLLHLKRRTGTRLEYPATSYDRHVPASMNGTPRLRTVLRRAAQGLSSMLLQEPFLEGHLKHWKPWERRAKRDVDRSWRSDPRNNHHARNASCEERFYFVSSAKSPR
jgi:hypothetical protein